MQNAQKAQCSQQAWRQGLCRGTASQAEGPRTVQAASRQPPPPRLMSCSWVSGASLLIGLPCLHLRGHAEQPSLRVQQIFLSAAEVQQPLYSLCKHEAAPSQLLWGVSLLAGLLYCSELLCFILRSKEIQCSHTEPPVSTADVIMLRSYRCLSLTMPPRGLPLSQERVEAWGMSVVAGHPNQPPRPPGRQTKTRGKIM